MRMVVSQEVEASLQIGVSPTRIKKFQDRILVWYTYNGRRFPWRVTNDPYKILVVEFLLQKTDVDKVGAVYDEFMERWPTVEELSKARDGSISKVIQPLGLQYRVSRLKATAKALVEYFGGQVPKEEKELLGLPGVGRYIASAVECFAYDKPKAVLDTNVIRILERVFEIKSDKERPRDDSRLWEMVQAFVPPKKAKEYNWGMLDYGALVCKGRNPLCGDCVLRTMCRFYKSTAA